MKILKGPSDKEADEVLKDLSSEEVFKLCLLFELGEYGFQKAVQKGLIKGKNATGIMLYATQAGSLDYVKYAMENGEIPLYTLQLCVNMAKTMGYFDIATYLLENENKAIRYG